MDIIFGIIFLATALVLLVAWVRSDTFTVPTGTKGARLSADALHGVRWW